MCLLVFLSGSFSVSLSFFLCFLPPKSNWHCCFICAVVSPCVVNLLGSLREVNWFSIPEKPLMPTSVRVEVELSEPLPYPCWNFDWCDLMQVVYMHPKCLWVHVFNQPVVAGKRCFVKGPFWLCCSARLFQYWLLISRSLTYVQTDICRLSLSIHHNIVSSVVFGLWFSGGSYHSADHSNQCSFSRAVLWTSKFLTPNGPSFKIILLFFYTCIVMYLPWMSLKIFWR